MQTSFMHPPFGFALFYLRGISDTLDKLFQLDLDKIEMPAPPREARPDDRERLEDLLRPAGASAPK